MFEAAEIGAKLPEKIFDRIKASLRLDLLELQRQCRENADFPVIVIVNGMPGAGLVDTVNLLNTWMDPRYIATTVFDTPTDEERQRPEFWRYWRSLPPAGKTALYLSGWYEDPIRDFAAGKVSGKAYAERLQRIAAFEQTLRDGGALLVKFWLHLSEADLAHSHREQRKDTLVGLRPTDSSLALPSSHANLARAGELAIDATDGIGNWHIIEGLDDTYRRASVLSLLREDLSAHITQRKSIRKQLARTLKVERKAGKKHGEPHLVDLAITQRHILENLKMPKVARAAYEERFHRLQASIYDAHKAARAGGLSTVLVFEGWDAAGKGGAIRRLSYALNARNYNIVPIAAPNDEERAHHYLWRFWRELQRAGRMTVFDRSWYGRVLVERVEHLIDAATCRRAYDEINAFEAELQRKDTLLLKFWMHITPQEQLARFKLREGVPYKRWKLTDEDWRNRSHWDAYEVAVTDMISATGTDTAPWHVIPANNKYFARLHILETVSVCLHEALKARGLKPARPPGKPAKR